MTRAIVHTDGSGLAQGGPAGIAYVARIGPTELEGSRSLANATNQQAEILAASLALHEIPPCDLVVLHSDSQYVVRGWGWLPGWIRRGWRTTSGPVANRRHWERLQEAVARHGDVTFRWVRGHNGNRGNERADALAYLARTGQPRP